MQRLLGPLSLLPKVSKGGPWVAGGCIRRLLMGANPVESDIDFFFASEDQMKEWEADLLTHYAAIKVFASASAKTYRVHQPGQQDPLTIQAITLGYYEDPSAVIDSFDFTICQFAWDGETLFTGEFSLWDLGRRRLVIHRVTFATATVRRLVKYSGQGFEACKGVAQAILRATADNPDIIRPEVEYVD